jgi:hypothetical protein
MNFVKSSIWIVVGVVAGWLIAYPSIEYTKQLLEYYNLPLYLMIILGIYLTFAIKFKNILWVRKFIKLGF